MSKRQIATLERKLENMKREEQHLRNELEVKESLLTNSFASVMGGGFGAPSNLTTFEDIASNNVYATLSNNPMMLTFFYKTHGIMQSAIDMPVQDALRGGFDIEMPEGDKDDKKALEEHLENMEFYHTLKQADIWTWTYGGGGLIIQDGTDPAKPFEIKKLYGRKLTFYAANRWELSSPNRFAKTYKFYGQTIDGSRVITMIGKDAPYILKQVVQNWGMSRVENLIEPLNIYLRTQNAVYDLLREAKVDVYKFKRFAELLASQKGENQALRRIQIMNMTKSNSSAVVLDAEDDFQQKQMTFSGLAQIWQENRISLASNLRMPMTKLFGISAAGFSSGEDDIENYNAMIESDFREHLKPTARQLLDIVMVNFFGEVPRYSFKFKPLRVMSTLDEENVKTQKHARYVQDYHDGILNAQEYAQILEMEGMLPIETEVAKGADPEPIFGDTAGGTADDVEDEEAA